jgi:hypothetical protein
MLIYSAITSLDGRVADADGDIVGGARAGGGTAFFPAGVRAELDLVDEGRFASGVAYPRYRSRLTT